MPEIVTMYICISIFVYRINNVMFFNLVGAAW